MRTSISLVMSSLGARSTLTFLIAVFCSGKMPWHAFSISLPATD